MRLDCISNMCIVGDVLIIEVLIELSLPFGLCREWICFHLDVILPLGLLKIIDYGGDKINHSCRLFQRITSPRRHWKCTAVHPEHINGLSQDCSNSSANALMHWSYHSLALSHRYTHVFFLLCHVVAFQWHELVVLIFSPLFKSKNASDNNNQLHY